MDRLENAIDDFYAAFRDVDPPKKIDGCEHCLDSKEVEILLGSPLRELQPDDLSSYAASAFLTVGNVEDYFYFLPRIMEISLHDNTWWPSMEVTARAIRATDIPSWPANRRKSLIRLLHAEIDRMLKTEEYFRLDEWLCAIGRMELDVQRFLTRIGSDHGAVLAYWEANAEHLHEGKLGSSFWQLPNKGHDDIVRWLKSDPIRKIYADAYGYKI